MVLLMVSYLQTNQRHLEQKFSMKTEDAIAKTKEI